MGNGGQGQDLVEGFHKGPRAGQPSVTRVCPSSTTTPAATATEATVPARGATIEVFIFIASMTSSVSPAATDCPASTATETTVPASWLTTLAASPAGAPDVAGVATGPDDVAVTRGNCRAQGRTGIAQDLDGHVIAFAFDGNAQFLHCSSIRLPSGRLRSCDVPASLA